VESADNGENAWGRVLQT